MSKKIVPLSFFDYKKILEDLNEKTLKETGVDHSKDTPVDGVAMEGGGWYFRCGNMSFVTGDAGRENILRAFEDEIKKYINKP